MEATLTVSKEHATPAEVVPRQNSATTHAAATLLPFPKARYNKRGQSDRHKIRSRTHKSVL
jgi:hypothetical protein